MAATPPARSNRFQAILRGPLLYLSRYINQHKADHYRLLQAVRTDGAWEEWLLYMLGGVEQTSHQTINLIVGIKSLMQKHKQKLRSELPRIYSQHLLNIIFSHPYTKIDHVMKDLEISRPTAGRYLEALTNIGLMSKHKLWRETYYINDDLSALLSNVNQT